MVAREDLFIVLMPPLLGSDGGRLVERGRDLVEGGGGMNGRLPCRGGDYGAT
jgi:hypothetical protein